MRNALVLARKEFRSSLDNPGSWGYTIFPAFLIDLAFFHTTLFHSGYGKSTTPFRCFPNTVHYCCSGSYDEDLGGRTQIGHFGIVAHHAPFRR